MWDDSFLIIFNAFHEDTEFVLPPRRFGRRWQIVVSTSEPEAPARVLAARAAVPVQCRSLLVLRRM
jgi:glycogen operon protein